MLSQITLNFYNELVKVEVPKNLSALRSQISKSFLFSPNDAEEIILTYNDKEDKILIQNDEDFKAFLSSSTDTINLTISQDSKIYKKNLNQINEEVSQDKKKLESLLKRNKELEELKTKKQISDKQQMTEIKKRINELEKQKNDLKHKIMEENRQLSKEKCEIETQIFDLQKKLGLEITVKPKQNYEFKVCPPFNPFRHAPPRDLPFMRGPHYQHHLRCHMRPCVEKAKRDFIFNQTMPQLKNSINENKELEIHHFVRCDGCGMAPLRGKRYKCKECHNFDYCESCFEKNKESHKHEFEIIEKSVIPYPPFMGMRHHHPRHSNNGKQIHFGIICDGCEMNPLVGKRYKCKECPDFDFCENCYEKNKENHKHEFKIVEKTECVRNFPFFMPPPPMRNAPPKDHHHYHFNRTQKNEEVLPVHHGVQCDGCGVFPIVGCRYKCGVCGDFDYCEECEKKIGEKHGHPFVKITRPEMAPNFIRIETDNKQ